MKEKIHTYENSEIEITYDAKRCIHSAECVKGLQQVFDPNERQWIRPENAPADSVAEVVTRCPTGSLHYRRKDGGPEETVPSRNTIAVFPDGPVYLRGNIEIRDHEDNLVLQDTRLALCRCGESGNKPACDNNHLKARFRAPAHIDSTAAGKKPEEKSHGKLKLKLRKNGPVLVEGNYQIFSNVSQPVESSKTIALCRCGGSSNKPFCDGTHKKIGFES